jgi:hypothetical protein
MPKINPKCIDDALKNLKNFTKEDLDNYVQDVMLMSRGIDPNLGVRSLDASIKKINEDLAQKYFSETTQKANNVMLFENNARDIKSGKASMRELLALRGDYLGNNIRGAQRAAYEKIISQVLGDLTHEEVEQFSSKEFGEVICDIYDGKKVDDLLGKKIADKLRDYFTYRKAQLILSGAMKLEDFNENRLFMAVHDQERIMNGSKSLIKVAKEKLTKKYDMAGHRETWVNTIKQHINFEKTFARTKAYDIKTGQLNMAEVDRILHRIFNNITSGRSQIFTKSVVANDREAIARKSRMFFVWKDMRSLYEYNKVYGKGNSLFDMFMSDAHSASSKIGMAQKFGDNPYAMYNDLRITSEDIVPRGTKWWANTDRYFKMVAGEDQLSESPTATKFWANLKSISTMARLPFISIDSTSDIAYIASFAQRMGINYGKAYTDLFTHMFNAFPNEERKRIAKLMSTAVDSHLGYMGRWTDVNNATDLLNKISTRYFKVNGLNSFDRGNKIGIMHLMAKHLFQSSEKSFDDIHPYTQRWINKFLSREEWDLLKDKNQGGLFTTENVDALSNDEIKRHFEKSDKTIPITDIRDDLYRKVHSMFSVAAENAVLSPGEFEKIFLYGGVSPGTFAGGIWGLFMQFKMYGLSYIDRVLIQGLRDADTASQKLLWATSMLAGTIPLSIMSQFFHYTAQGLSMPDWDDMNVPARIKFSLNTLAPSLAIFSGILDARNQNSDLVWSLLGSPSTRLIGNTLAAPLALATGNPELAAKNLSRAANYVFPIQTTPVVSPIIRQVLGQEAYLEPGQTHLFGQ